MMPSFLDRAIFESMMRADNLRPAARAGFMESLLQYGSPASGAVTSTGQAFAQSIEPDLQSLYRTTYPSFHMLGEEGDASAKPPMSMLAKAATILGAGALAYVLWKF